MRDRRSACSRIAPGRLGLPRGSGGLASASVSASPTSDGQRRAQVVRERGQDRGAQPLGNHLDLRGARHLDVVQALDGDGHQRRHVFEQRPQSSSAAPSAANVASTPRTCIGAASGR